MLVLFVTILLVALFPPVALAQGLITDGVYGDFELAGGPQFTCQFPVGMVCNACVDDIDTHDFPTRARLTLVFGTSAFTGSTTGALSGTVSPWVRVDGLIVTPDLFPTGSFFRTQLVVSTSAPFNSLCGLSHLNYEIGSVAGVVTETGISTIDIPAEEAAAIQFSFSFCDVFVYWGGGCGVTGSASRIWRLHLPGELNAATVAVGDPGPIDFPNQNISIDFASAVGGTVTALQSADPSPLGPPVLGPAGYWEVSTDMAADSYMAWVTVEYDETSLPIGTRAESLKMIRFDEAAGAWEVLPSTVDLAAQTVTGLTTAFSVLALTIDGTVTNESTSWGELKATY